MVYGGEHQSRQSAAPATRGRAAPATSTASATTRRARRHGPRLLAAARLGRPVPPRRERRRPARGAARPERAHRAAHRRRRARRACSSASSRTASPAVTRSAHGSTRPQSGATRAPARPAMTRASSAGSRRGARTTRSRRRACRAAHGRRDPPSAAAAIGEWSSRRMPCTPSGESGIPPGSQAAQAPPPAAGRNADERARPLRTRRTPRGGACSPDSHSSLSWNESTTGSSAARDAGPRRRVVERVEEPGQRRERLLVPPPAR